MYIHKYPRALCEYAGAAISCPSFHRPEPTEKMLLALLGRVEMLWQRVHVGSVGPEYGP